MMRSLRGQLGLAVALGAFVLTLVAGLLVGFERWKEESNSLPGIVELDAFRLSEIDSADELDGSWSGGRDGFALVFDDRANVIGFVGEIDDFAMEVALEIWTETTEQDLIYGSTEELGDGTELTISGVACIDQEVCDTVVVGRAGQTLQGFLLARIPWLIGPSLIVSALTFLAATWLVGRALRPVEKMRSEVAVITASELDRRVPQPDTGDELEQLATTLNETLARLQASSEATERFAADAAHELRSPITGVRAAVELRADDDELLSDALLELDRASRLIDDLLVLAKRQAGPPERTDIDLDDIVRSDVAAARSRFPEVAFETALVPVRVSGDPDGLRRVASNLIENAANYSDGTVRVSLTIGDGGDALLTVDDDGPGIPADERERVFERFARLDESRARATGGSGLGLALVSELVADHGGSVTVGDAGLGGARFEVALPNGR